MENRKPIVLIMGNYKNLGNVGDDIYRRLLEDIMAKNGIDVVTSTTSPKKVDGIILGGGGVLNAVSIKRLEALEKYGQSMPSAIISAGMAGCVIPENIGPLMLNVDIATVRDTLAWQYGRGCALLGPDMAFAISPSDERGESYRTKVGFSLRTRKKDDLPLLKEICEEITRQEQGNAIDVNSYMREKYYSRIPEIEGISDRSYDGSLDSYLDQLKQCKIVVCSQYHAVVLSIICGCAVCGYIYSEKVEDLVKILGLSDYFTKDIHELPYVYKKATEDMPVIDSKLVASLRRNAIQTHIMAIERTAELVRENFEEKSIILC